MFPFEEESEKQGKSLIQRISNIKKGKTNKSWLEYENACFDALRYLFDPPLLGWHKQKGTADGLNRYDLVCRIGPFNKDLATSFWSELSLDCNTRYVVFEFKNYKEKISQGQIYTTEKYLLAKALRTVAFILARSNADKNAIKATQGILRESGKIIIVLSEDDLFSMLNLMDNGDEPSRVLVQKFDELMITLPK